MHHKATIYARAVAVIALAIVCACTAVAQDAAAAKIAVVSLQRVQADYQSLHMQEDSLGQWLQQRKSYHDRLTNFVFLPKKEFEEALELVQQAPPLSEEDQQRLEELRRISDKNDERFCALRAKTDRTAEETAEFNALQDMYDASAQTLQAVQDRIMQEFGTRRQTALTGLMDTVKQAINEVAAEAGYDLVLDADMVFYGGEDITDAVVAKLNEGVEQPAEDVEQPAEDGGEQDQQGGGEGGDETGEQGG
ncbi:MAG: hypothetical protein GF393_04205 [Armatimonadia bacterium]|nr:hypothetical protein [Armatimonadia bacterium]